jgi:predicted outer membrane repeat protein
LCLEFFEIFTDNNLTCVITLPVDSQTSLEPGTYGQLTFDGSNAVFAGKNLTLIVTGPELSSLGDIVRDTSARGRSEASLTALRGNFDENQQDLLRKYTQSEPTAAPTSATETITCPYYSAKNSDFASVNYASCFFEACGSKTISISGCDSCVYDQFISLLGDGLEVAFNDDGCGGGGCAALTYTFTPTFGNGDEENATCSQFELRQGCNGNSTCGGQFVVTITETDFSPTSTPTEQPTASFAAPGAESATSIVGDDAGGFIYIEGKGANFSVVLNNLIIQDFGRLDQLIVDVYSYYGDDDGDDDDDHGSIAGALFVVDADITISNTLLRNNQALFGGAVTLQNARLTMVSSALIKNTGRYGGALFAASGAEAVQLEDCVFDANYATLSGGALYAIDDNPGWKYTRVTFSSNSAALYGGALYIVNSNNEWAFVNCSFAFNVARGEFDGSGGAIAVQENNNYWQFDSVEFVGNKAAYGGALWTGPNNYWDITSCTFNTNVAPLAGAGIYVETVESGEKGFRNWTVDGSVFSFNTAGVDGGAMAISGSSIDYFTYTNNTFIGNTASSNGGALMFSGSITQYVIIGNVFVENSGIRIVFASTISSIYANNLPSTYR